MAIRVTGLNSGLDTDSIIKELVSAYRTKGDKIKKQQTKLSWTQDKWKSLNAKVLNLYKSLDNFRFTNGYNLKKTTVSDSTKATVTASREAVNGTQTLTIKETAKGGYLTGEQLTKSKRNGSATKLSDLGFSGEGTFRISGNGVNTEFTIKDTDTIETFINNLNESGTGVKASYDAANQRIFIASTSTGKASDFTLVGLDRKGSEALYNLGVNVESVSGMEEAAAWLQYYQGGTVDVPQLEADLKALRDAKNNKEIALADTELRQTQNSEYSSAISYLGSYKDMKLVEDKIGNADDAEILSQLANMSETDRARKYIYDSTTKKLTEATQDEINANDPRIMDGASKYQSLMTGVTQYQDKKDDDGNVVMGSDGKPVQEETEEYQRIKAYSTNREAAEKYDGKYKLTAGATVATAEAKIKEYEGNIETNNTAIKNNDNTVLDQDEIIKNHRVLDGKDITAATTDAEISAYAQSLKSKIEYFSQVYQETAPGSGKYELIDPSLFNDKDKANKIDGQDAEIYLNNMRFTSETNTFNVNGLSIQANAKTTEEITITTATDTQGLYDKIKDFISEYNSLINEMSSLYNADSSKGYEPLTSEEKESLSESEIADWEKKIKDSLLRRDSNLSTLINTMTSAMSSTFEVNGKKYSLATLGIKTGSYFSTTAATRYMYHIDGDQDDDTTSANADKLMAMLNSDPDTVIEIMKGATNALYDNLSKQMKTSTLRSYQSIYNDKAMAQSYSDYTKKISAWEEKVNAIEESYYKKFAAMETALAKLQSQQSAFSGLLGS